MPLEIGLWRIDESPRRLLPLPLGLEARLEQLIEDDPTVLGQPVLLVGRQVPTAFGKYVDLLAVDADGVLHVLELKRDRTPREVVAQALDYGSWVESLSHQDVLDLFGIYRPGVAFETAFFDRFGTAPPEELNTAHQLTVVASEVDPATARIVEYLARFDVPINVMFFRYFADGDAEYLARTWLVADGPAGVAARRGRTESTKEPWNGQDWHVEFGDGDHRSWEDARSYGFVSAGGSPWFSRTLRSLPVGGRVFVHVPGVGYVGVGEVAREAAPFEDAVVNLDGAERRLADLDLRGSYRHETDNDDPAEYIVPVRWIATVPLSQAVWEKGFYANQNAATRLRNRFTLEGLTRRFALDDR